MQETKISNKIAAKTWYIMTLGMFFFITARGSGQRTEQNCYIFAALSKEK